LDIFFDLVSKDESNPMNNEVCASFDMVSQKKALFLFHYFPLLEKWVKNFFLFGNFNGSEGHDEDATDFTCTILLFVPIASPLCTVEK
jgi:hypothetical protein